MKNLTIFFIFISMIGSTHALIINEIMSNPIGDDSGREWVEVYNDTDSDIDVSQLTLSVKGGTFVPITPVSGGATIAAHGYAIIGSTVSGVTRFTQDFPSYTGPLFKSTMNLVNTGVASLEIRLQGSSVSLLSSYTAAKEGFSYSLIAGSYSSVSPTPGEENKALVSEDEAPTTISQTGNQTTFIQSSPPLADITLYLPDEKTVVAGAPAPFNVFSTTHSGLPINNMSYTWAFGDGGQGTGSSTLYRFLYPGRYIVLVEGTNGLIAGTAKMTVRVVSPEVILSSIKKGKYGLFIDITNPNNYELDLSLWKLSIDGVLFSFPKNTILSNGVTRFPGSALGFASTTFSSSTIIKLLFQNMDEVLRVTQQIEPVVSTTTIQKATVAPKQVTLQKATVNNVHLNTKVTPNVASKMGPLSTSSSTVLQTTVKKDTRLASFFRSLFTH